MNITVRAENAVPGCFRFRIRACVTTALAVLVFSAVAQAKPNPLNATITPAAPSKQFSGSLVVSDPTGASCGAPGANQNPAPGCDEFKLTVTLPADYATTNPNAKVRVSMAFDDEDYDLYVYEEVGFKDVGSSDLDNPEVVEFPAGSGSKVYLIDVVGFVASGGTYTTTMTLIPGAPAGDADGDGVADASDLCPNTPPGPAVDATGCPIVIADTDGDGVTDASDLCPGTPTGTPVDGAGCPITTNDPKCTAPGLTVMTDAVADQVGGADTDLVSVKLSESVTTQRNLVFTVKMSSLASRTENARRVFTFKAKTKDYYVAMINNPGVPDPVFSYGTGVNGYGGSDQLGTGLAGSGFSVDGTFTVVVPISGFELAAGNSMGTFAGVVRLSGGNCNAACANGPAADTATAPTANSYTLTANGTCGIPNNSVVLPSGLAPRFQIHVSPKDLGNDAGEPSVGFNPFTKRTMFISYTQALRETYAELSALTDVAGNSLPTSCDATWEDKSGTLTQVNSLDPILFTDQATGRTFNSQLSGDNSLMEYTDDDGENWFPAQAGPPNGGADHQAVASGPYPAGKVPLTATWPATGPKRAVYYCSQSVATAFCSRSDDGGVTFGPGFTFKNTECAAGALHGHVKVAPDGTVYVPDSSQCVLATGASADHVIAFASEDAGQTWAVRPVPQSIGGDGSDPSIGIATDGTLYMCYPNADSSIHVAVSHDKGRTWAGGQNVGAALGLVQTRFPQMIAGDPDRASCAFLGTNTGGNGSSLNFKGVWHGYQATTYDGGASWHLVNVTPGDPIQGHGGVGPDGTNRNLLDFNDLQLDEQGRTLFAFADGCIGACVQDPAVNSFAAKATIVRQTGGRTLYKKFDDVSDLSPVPRYNTSNPIIPAPACTLQGKSSRTSTRSTVKWNAPDTGGNAITNYKVHRSLAAAGPFSFLGNSGSDTQYFDTTADPAVQKYYYKVVAENALGLAPDSNVIELVVSVDNVNTCVAPGDVVITDPAGDASPQADEMDIIFVGVHEPEAYPDSFVFTYKVANFTSGAPPSGGFYPVMFPALSNKYIAMRAETVPPRFEYGTFAVATTTSFTAGGNLNPASNFKADGTITLIVPRSYLGNPAIGAVIPGFEARSRIGANTTSRDSSATADYTVRGTAICVQNVVLADLAASTNAGDEPLNVTFTLSGTPPQDAEMTSYSILFGDEPGADPVPTTGSFLGSGSLQLVHTYSTSGVYRARLTVTDSLNDVSTNLAEQTISVNHVNLPPDATASSIAALDEGQRAELNGSASSDPENEALRYSWIQLSGPAVTLENAGTAKAQFTAPEVTADTPLTFQITVKDSAGATASADVTISVLNIPGLNANTRILGGAPGPWTLLGLIGGLAARRRRFRRNGTSIA